MRSIKGWTGAPWVAIGLAVGALLAPAAAISAAGVVKIIGSNGKKAQVTKAYQLQTAPATPSQFKGFYETAVTTTCKAVFTVPGNKSYVMTRAVLNVYQNTTPGTANWIGLFRDAACSQLVVIDNAPGLGADVIPFEPGYGVKAGGKLYTMTTGNVRGEVYVHGYYVPKSAVKSSTSVTTVAAASSSANH